MKPPKHFVPHIILLITLIIPVGFSSIASPNVKPNTPAPVTPADAAPNTAPALVTSYIVQASSADVAGATVAAAGGTITRRLNIINGVAADLDAATLATLQHNASLIIHPNRSVMKADDNDGDDDDDSDAQETDTNGLPLYPAAATGAHLLHRLIVPTVRSTCTETGVTITNETQGQWLRGKGVTVAIVDTGLMEMFNKQAWKQSATLTNTLIAASNGRCIVYHDVLAGTNPITPVLNSSDPNGHGTHVASTIADNVQFNWVTSRTLEAVPTGIAPDVNLVIARALGADGTGSYADVIAGIEWVVEHKEQFNIRILNLSLYAPVMEAYWGDPLNQAVMQAWNAGIVVVVAAGNDGPNAGTVAVPGNIPYVISVGALKSGRYTENGRDTLANYSARGPTESAFVKPDIIVPASNTIAPMPTNGTLTQLVKENKVDARFYANFQFLFPTWEHGYYKLSGTSMAAAEVSGLAALMLQATPTLTNNQVKYRLLATARPAIDDTTQQPRYTIWEQGAGLVHAAQAVFTTTQEIANVGMDIALDLDLTSDEHYWGFTMWDEATGEFKLVDPDSGEVVTIWTGNLQPSNGSTWLWISGRRSGAGGRRSGAGGRRSGAGSDLTWAGSDRPWLNPSALQDTGALSRTIGVKVIAETDTEPQDNTFLTWLPLVQR